MTTTYFTPGRAVLHRNDSDRCDGGRRVLWQSWQWEPPGSTSWCWGGKTCCQNKGKLAYISVLQWQPSRTSGQWQRCQARTSGELSMQWRNCERGAPRLMTSCAGGKVVGIRKRSKSGVVLQGNFLMIYLFCFPRLCDPARPFTAYSTLLTHYRWVPRSMTWAFDWFFPTFEISFQWIAHFRSHAGLRPFECSLCGATFTRQHSLNYHLMTHANQTRFSQNEKGKTRQKTD